MGGAGGVQAAGAGVGHVGLDGGHAQVLHEGLGGFAATLHAEAHHAAGAVGQVLLGEFVALVAFKAGVLHPRYKVVRGEEAGHGKGVLTVAGHAYVQAFEAEVQQEGVLRRLDGAEVAHELGRGLGDVRPGIAELGGVGDAVVAFVRRAEAGELVGMGHPVELAGIHDTAANACAVAVHVLGGGVDDDVRPPLEGAAVHGRGEGVVHDERHAVGMGGLGEALDIEDHEGGVGDGLAEHGLGVGAEGGFELFVGAVGRNEGEVDAHALHGDGEEVVRAAVDGGGSHDMVALAGKVEHAEEGGGLPGRGEHGGRSALKLGYLGGHVVVGGVLKAGVEIAAGLEVEELAHVFAGIVLEGRALDDGDLAGFAVAGGVAALYAGGLDASGHDVSFMLRGLNGAGPCSLLLFPLGSGCRDSISVCQPGQGGR